MGEKGKAHLDYIESKRALKKWREVKLLYISQFSKKFRKREKAIRASWWLKNYMFRENNW